jgi:PIN domain nuclease of toxin-antitoxin system
MILDASALLAYLQQEHGCLKVEQVLPTNSLYVDGKLVRGCAKITRKVS